MPESKAKLDATYRPSANIVTREIVGETLLVPVRGELADMQRIFSLTPSGAFIWSALDGTRELADIAEAVVAEFDTDSTHATTDCLEFVGELLEAGLVEEG